jgi:hypothetical protein
MSVNRVGKYKILASSKLIVEYYSGTIIVDDFLSFKDIISKETNYNFFFNTILDLRDSELILTTDDLKKINHYFEKKFNKNINETNIRKVVYLVKTPKQAALSFLYLTSAKKVKMNQMVFSTVDALVKWFNMVSNDEKLVTSTLKQLRIEPSNIFK